MTSWRVALSLLALVTVTAEAVGLCELERRRANQTMSRIYREWPLRPSGDPVDQSVQHIASQLARRSGQDGNRRWRTHIVRDLNLNAFSVGDGHVFITEGMLDFVASEAELAALIAHEFGHHLAGHFCTPGPKRGFWGSLFGGNDDTKRSRQRVGSLTALVDPELEREADRIATRILDRAGYDPHA